MDDDRPLAEPPYMAFLREVAAQGFRITYAGLSQVYRLCNGDTPESEDNAEHGVWVVKNALPGVLQPYVCEAGGDYDEDALARWQEQEVDVPVDLMERRVIPTANAVKAFERWTQEQAGDS